MFQKLTNFLSKAFQGGGDLFVRTAFPGFYSHRSYKKLLGEYKNLAYACINAIAEEVAKYEPIFKDKNGKAVNHPFSELLNNPNPMMSKYELLEATEIYLNLVGEAYWFVGRGKISNRPRSLDIIRPDKIKHYYNDEGDLIGFAYVREDGQEMPLDLNEVIFFKRFNPINPQRGLGTIEAGLLYMDVENGTTQFQNAYLNNQASPSGVLSLSGNVKPEAFKKLKTQWAETQAGLGNAGKTLFIRASEAKFEKIGLSLADLPMESLKKISQRDIRQMFRVPEQLLGAADSSNGLGRNNIDSIEYIFMSKTIEPKLQRMDDTIKLNLPKLYPDNKKTEVSHVSQVPQDREFLLTLNDKAVDRWKTRNEVRAEYGLEPIKGGDKLYNTTQQTAMEQKVLRKLFVLKKASREEFLSKLDVIENAATKGVAKRLSKYLSAQEKKIIELLPAITGKKTLRKNFPIDGAITFGTDDLVLDLLELFLIGLVKAAKQGLDFSGKPDLEFILEQATRDAVFNSTERLMKSFNDETALLIQKQLAAGVANKESNEELTKRIESIYADAKGYRAERIARTESHKVVNEGVSEAYLAAGYKKMRWITRGASCEFCKALDGKEITIGGTFLSKGDKVVAADGKEYLNDYTDVQYADLHPNCDCGLEPV